METAKKTIQDKETREMNPKPHAHMYTPEEMDRLPGREMTDKRTGNSKVFSLGGNQFQSILYPDPVHYMDKKTGQWMEIDNTLIPASKKKTENNLINRDNGDLKVRLCPSATKQMVVLEDTQGRVISWMVEEAMPVTPRVMQVPQIAAVGRDQRRKVLEKAEGKAVYADIFPDTDLVCTVLPNGFKDEIIFKSPEAVKPISFLLSTPNLVLSKLESGVLDAVAPTGEIVFRFPAPLMTDEKPEHDTGKVDSSLEHVGEDQWRLTYTPDMEWISQAVFPVVLDPLVFTVKSSAAIDDNFVTSKQPSTVQPNTNTNLRVAYNHGVHGTCKAYVKFPNTSLPVIPSSHYVTKAYFSIALKARPTHSTSVYLKEVLGDWNPETICYNNQPATDSRALDYEYFTTGSTLNVHSDYDITNMVRKWYTGTNYGMMFEVTNDTLIELYSSSSVYYKPYVTINYVSLAGLEDYLAYESQSAGRAGTGYVSLYNGNMVFEHQDYVCNGNRLPLSVTHYYNSCYKASDAFHLGNGWKHSLQQTLHRENITNQSGTSETYYVYMDGDGTRHYFKKPSASSTYYEDLSGLSLNLTIAGSIVTIKDKGDNTMTFELPTVDFDDNYANVKMLNSIQDAQGTTATLAISGTNVLSAADGAGRNTAFTITNGRLGQINAPGYSISGVSFAYNILGQLTQITHEDGAVTTYTYNALGLLETAVNHDDLKVKYDYYIVQEPYRVRQVTISKGNNVYSGRRYEYGDGLTTITDLYVLNADDPYASDELVEGKKLFYHFNDYGNVISINDQLGYAVFAKYSDLLPMNHPEVVSKMQHAVCNLLQDHSFEYESTSAWSQNYNGGTGNFSYDTSQRYMGIRSLKMAKTNGTGNMHIAETANIERGKTYTVSAYVRGDASMRFVFSCMYYDASGNAIWNSSSEFQIAPEWNRFSHTITIPSNSTQAIVTPCLCGVGGPGNLWMDCVQLEEGPTANRYNMLINGDFSLNSGAHPTGWTASEDNTAEDIVYTTYSAGKPEGLSANTMRIYGAGGGKQGGIHQNIRHAGQAGDVFVAGGWAMAYSRPRKGDEHRFNIRVSFNRSDNGVLHDAPPIEWSEEWSGWQFAAGPVVAPCDYSNILFYVEYENNIHQGEFDGLFFHKEEFGRTFKYDGNGNVDEVRNLAGQKSDPTFDAFNNMTSYVQTGRPSAVKTVMEYGATDNEKKKHLLLKATDPMGVVQTYQYNAAGCKTLAQTQDSAVSSYIRGTTSYTPDMNYAASQTDARGRTVTSVTDTAKGTLTSVTDPNNQTVSYAYDILKRTTAATATADGKTYKNEYVYTSDKLTQIKHNTTDNANCDVVYNFAYDEMGNPTTVQVGATILSTNVYTATGDKLLEKVEYGNGKKVVYARDGYKRIIGLRYDNESNNRYQYVYGANGQIAQVKDNNLSRLATYEYDLANRPMRIKQIEGTTHLYTSTLGYDIYNNLSSLREKAGSAEYATSYAYDNGNRPTAVQFGSAANQVGYAYDALGRVTTRTLTVGGTNYASTYEFAAGGQGSGSTTTLVSSITQNGQRFGYAYDNVGNIAGVDMYRDPGVIPQYQTYAVKDEQGNQVYGEANLTLPVSAQIADAVNVEWKITYQYDKLGQLVRVNDPYDKTAGACATTWVYSYGRGGNIISKAMYAYTTGTLGMALQTISYTYDSTWKDKLTAYNGVAITYDAIGNPLTDGTWAYTWQGGRQLASMAKSGTTAAFAYNADGLRVRKTVNGTVTDYTLHGKQVMHVKQGSNTLHFFYDAKGWPAVVEFNGSRYGYVHNLQGDVVALIDGSGNQVVEYTYDAWGKPLTKTGTLATTLGTLNPFRYRGYVYDEETGLYYLRSRYYNPVWGRFVNTDALLGSIGCLLTHNAFIYCRNRPIGFIDPNGSLDRSIWSLKSDTMGRTILYWYLFWGGHDFISKGSYYGNYMMKNRILTQKVKDIVFPLSASLKKGESVKVDITTSMEIENGEDIIGYQYLHGTNAKVGGFTINGDIAKNNQDDVIYDLQYAWNDMIDPNFDYVSDKKKLEFAKKIPFANPTDFYIRIEWSDKTIIRANPGWFNWNSGWLQ